MCKAIKDGGKRCNYHLCSAASSAFISLAAALTRLPHKNTKDAFAALEGEGANLPAPSRQEVDDVLRKAVMQVEHDPTLSDAKKASVLHRLRDAIGRALPSGATLHAWKNIVAEAWARNRRRVVAVFFAGALSMGVGACGNTSTTPAHSAAQPPAATATATPAQATSSTAEVSVAPANFTGEAVDVYGQDKIQAAYKEMSDFAAKHTFDPKLLGNQNPTVADFDSMTSEMTPSMKASFEGNVQKALAGDNAASQSLYTIAFYDINGEGVTWPKSGPSVSDETISNPQASVDRSTGSPRLALTYNESGSLPLLKDGKPADVKVTKSQSVWLVPGDDGEGWLIDGISGTYHFDATGA